jgi:hypothetical protein
MEIISDHCSAITRILIERSNWEDVRRRRSEGQKEMTKEAMTEHVKYIGKMREAGIESTFQAN